MKTKEIVALVLFCIFVLPVILKIAFWTGSLSVDSSQEHLDEAPDLIKEAVIPWWMGPLEFLSGLGTLGAILILGFIVFLNWAGEIR